MKSSKTLTGSHALPAKVQGRRVVSLLMRVFQFFTEGCMFPQQQRCYDARMRKFLLATLLVMVVAAPAFAATKHHHHRHHHHHKA